MHEFFVGFDLTDFWQDSEYARKEYVCLPVTPDVVKTTEDSLGYKLPASYIALMKTQNGGCPLNTAVPCQQPTTWAKDHVAISNMFGIGSEKNYSLCGFLGSQFMIDMWEYPDIGVYFCDCPSGGHDMVALDYRECGNAGEPRVVHVDQDYDFKITPLSDNFEGFVRSLKHENQFHVD